MTRCLVMLWTFPPTLVSPCHVLSQHSLLHCSPTLLTRAVITKDNTSKDWILDSGQCRRNYQTKPKSLLCLFSCHSQACNESCRMKIIIKKLEFATVLEFCYWFGYLCYPSQSFLTLYILSL